MDIFNAAQLYQNHSLMLSTLWMFYIFVALLTVKFTIESKSLHNCRVIMTCLIIAFIIFAITNGSAIVFAETFREILWKEIFRTGLNLEMQGNMDTASLPIHLSVAIKRLDIFTPLLSGIIHFIFDVIIIIILIVIRRAKPTDD